MFYVYILKCADSTFYTGYTDNLENRLCMHNRGVASKYTRSRTPVILEYFEEYDTKSSAMSREAAIKKLSRKEKIKLIAERKES